MPEKGIIMPSLFSLKPMICWVEVLFRCKTSGYWRQQPSKAAAQTKLLHTVATDKDPIVHVGKWLGKAAWAAPPLGKAKPIPGIAFHQWLRCIWWKMQKDGEIQCVPQGDLILRENNLWFELYVIGSATVGTTWNTRGWTSQGTGQAWWSPGCQSTTQHAASPVLSDHLDRRSPSHWLLLWTFDRALWNTEIISMYMPKDRGLWLMRIYKPNCWMWRWF